MEFPIKLKRGGGHFFSGFRRVHMHGKPTVHKWKNKPNYFHLTYEEVKFEVWVAEWLYFLPTIPEMLWQRMLSRFWYDRLGYQYECGRADGLREAYESYEALRSLTDGERQALFARPVSQQEHEAEMKQATK